MPKTKRPPSGAAKLKASGRRAIMLAVTPEEYATLQEAAQRERRSLSGYIVFQALAAARAAASAKTTS